MAVTGESKSHKVVRAGLTCLGRMCTVLVARPQFFAVYIGLSGPERSNMSLIWVEAVTVPIKTKICITGNHPDVITCANEIFGVTIVQRVELPLFLLISG